jgi:ankyrin repeat protein
MTQADLDESYLEAAEFGTLDRVKQYLAAGAQLQCRDSKGRNALFAAAINNDLHPEVARFLLDAGVEHDVALPNGYHLAEALAQNGPADVLDAVLTRGIAVEKENKPKGATLLMRAAGALGNPATVQVLLARGARVDATDRQGNTALHYLGNVETVEMLLDAGANIEARNGADETPLLKGLKVVENESVVGLLIARGANIEAVCSGLRPVHVAVQNGSPGGLALLLAAGADPNSRTFAGSTLRDMIERLDGNDAKRAVFGAYQARATMRGAVDARPQLQSGQ